MIHLSGPLCRDILAALFRSKSAPFSPDPSRIFYGHVVVGADTLDEVIVRYLGPDVSFTGEESAEINCHGGVAATRGIMDALEHLGVRRTNDRGLLQRAVSNRKLTATRAEAWLELARARTELALRTLLRQYSGELDREIEAIRQLTLAEARSRLESLRKSAAFGLALTRPSWVVLAGPANSGKSTLFNALAEEERVLVSPVPGTTRDYVTREIAVNGIPIVLVDTAGYQANPDRLARKAIEKTGQALAQADLVVCVSDATGARGVLPKVGVPVIQVRNKIDLLAPAASDQDARSCAAYADGESVGISALRGIGLDLLREKIARTIAGNTPDAAVVFTERQLRLVSRTLECEGPRSLDSFAGEMFWGEVA